VIGASMAGLLAARVLHDHFAKVTVVERDPMPGSVQPRKGVPQGRHLHVLHTRGEQILDRLFPGLSAGLTLAGAARLDVPGDLLWFHFGGYNARFRSGLTTLAMSRPLLESHVCRRVLALSNVEYRRDHDAIALHTVADRARVTGVTVRPTSADGGEELIEADLVVDACGRGSRSPAWLESLGYGRPPETTVTIGFAYTTRLYWQNAASLPDVKAIFVQPTPPHQKRLGALFPIEGGRWIVTLGGYRDHHAAPSEEGFLEHARALAAPDLYRALLGAEPASNPVSYGLPSNLRRHYERMRRFPAGYLVIGDAICSFNPSYAQGITVSALEVEALDRILTQHDGEVSAGLAHAYFSAAAERVDHAWMVAAGEDFRYSGVVGPKAPGTRLVNWYVGHIHRATHTDAETSAAFVKVLMSLEKPMSLLRPRIALKAMQAALRS
jgi:2-polyprenyl-6-methoxyphenol hydroxylase-like FAD-dependent oxidoreductase